MKKSIIIFCILLITSISFSQSRKIKKNFELIKTGAFIESYQSLNEIKTKEANSPYTYYLLSLYFGDDRNTNKNIDSCFFNFKTSVKLAKTYLDKKELGNACNDIQFCEANLTFQLDSISSVAFKIYSLEKNINSIKKFIELYKETSSETNAKNLLDKILFNKAQESESIAILERFINDYPNSNYIDSAKNNIENILYSEVLNQNELDGFNNFIKLYPNSNFIKDIEIKRDKKAFELTILRNSELEYNAFISNYPNSYFLNDAIKKRNIIVYDEAKISNNLQTYKNVLKKYPDIEFAIDINENIIKLEQNITDSSFVDFRTNNEHSSFNDDNIVSITVSGSGKTKEAARLVALKSATEQVFGAFISSKTEIFSDRVLSDEIVSVSNGNVQSFSILNESQTPDGNWGVTLKVQVSITKLTNFSEIKGIVIENRTSQFTTNIKKQMLNEQGEYNSICEMVGYLHEPMQTSFNYVIKTSIPQSLDSESKNWEIPLEVTAIANKNMDFCANYFIKTIAALCLSSEEITNYQNLNKSVFILEMNYKNFNKTFYLRSKKSINIIKNFSSQWKFYASLFSIKTNTDEIFGNGDGGIIKIIDSERDSYNHFPFPEKNNINIHEFYTYINEVNYGEKLEKLIINFLTSDQQAATYTWQDKRTLNQIEQINGYEIKAKGIVSHFKHGGFVVYEENGHGLIASIKDLGSFNNIDSAKNACLNLVINGYNDWYLPSNEELNKLYLNLYRFGSGSFKQNSMYWSSTFEKESSGILCEKIQHFSDGWQSCTWYEPGAYFYWQRYDIFVRAVRTF